MAEINLSKEVMAFLEDYVDDVGDVTRGAVKEVAKEATRTLRQTSPKGKTGKYAKGWAYKVEEGRLYTSATIYGKSGTYQLAHLLERSHALRGGGRSKPQVHIAPVEEWANKNIETKIIEKVKRL